MTYPNQIDCVWLAVDHIGMLGAMITAGSGPIPRALLNDAIDVTDSETLLLSLPVIGQSKEFADAASFSGLAQRGFFVYDWSDVHRTGEALNSYELHAAPSSRLRFCDLPEHMRSYAFGIDVTLGTKLLTLPWSSNLFASPATP